MRNDTGVYEGGEISIYYDPMIAKLVTHAPTREAAIDAQAEALDAFVIDGIRHNIPFLSALMAASALARGQAVDRLHRRGVPGRLPAAAPEGERAKMLAAVAVAIDHVLGERKRRISGQMDRPRRDARDAARVWLGDRNTVDIADGRAFGDGTPAGAGRRSLGDYRAAGASATSQCDRPTGGRASRCGPAPSTASRSRCRCGRCRTALCSPIAASRRPGLCLHRDARPRYARLMPVKRPADTGKLLLCPMPGLVVSIAVAEGQEVKAGETLAVVEAMKMENMLRAERDGTVKKINAKPGDSLAVDAVILEFA